MRECKAALFDLDGVIIDTEPIYSGFWDKAGKMYDVPYPDLADRVKGTTLPKILDTYFPKDKHPQINQQLLEFEEKMRYELFPGAIEFLRKLRDKGIPCAIVTSSGEPKMTHLGEQQPELYSLMQAIITDADVTHSKPHPEPYLIAAERLGVNPKECWIFEDSFNGLKSARSAGGFVVGLATTNSAEAIAPYADIVVPSLDAINLND